MHAIEKIPVRNAGVEKVSASEIVTAMVDFAEEGKRTKTIITGPVTIVGDNIGTDQILPGRFPELTDPKAIGSYCLYGVDESIALLNMGAGAVLAGSCARIFYRNAINLGLSVITCAGISKKVQPGLGKPKT